MRKRIVQAIGMVFCMCILLCACQSQERTASDKIYIGVTYYDQSDTFLNELLDCFKKYFAESENEEMKVTVTVRDAAGSQRTQNEQVKELIDAGCNVLCVNLVDRTAPSEIIDLARGEDVPVIFFNREPVAEDLMQWDKCYYVGAKAEESGVMQGELAADAILGNEQADRNGDGKIQYVVLEGEPGHQDAIIRTENAVATLESKGITLEKLSYGIANWNRAQAQNRMTQMLGEHKDQIELVLANNDDMVLGAIDAYDALKYMDSERPLLFGIDGTDMGLKAMEDLKLSGTVYNDKEGQAAAMAELAVAIVSESGMEEIEFENDKYIYLPYSKVSLENIDDFQGR